MSAFHFNTPDAPKKTGDLVWFWFDTGLGVEQCYGRVIAAGQKTFRVRWMSGLTNRIKQDSPGVRHVKVAYRGEAERWCGAGVAEQRVEAQMYKLPPEMEP